MATVPAKAIIADALVYCPQLVLTGSQIKTALAVADFMHNGAREAWPAQATIAQRRRCHETRVREALKVICRRPDEPHNPTRHIFVVRFRCIPWADGRRRGGRKQALYSVAPEFEAMVIRARNETPDLQADQSSETPDLQADRSATETPDFGDRNAGVGPTETTPRGSPEAVKEPLQGEPLRATETPALQADRSPWDNVARQLSSAMPSHLAATWLRPLRAHIVGDTLVVVAPGLQHLDWLHRNRERVRAAASAAGVALAVRFELEKSA